MTLSNGNHTFASTAGHSSAMSSSSTAPSSQKFLKQHTVSIVGCPFSGGQKRSGVDGGPNKLIEAGLVEQLKGLGWNVEFQGHEKFDEICQQYAGNDGECDAQTEGGGVSSATLTSLCDPLQLTSVS